MIRAWTLAWHEIRQTWRSPSFFFVLALFLFYQGIIFAVTVSLRQHPLSPPGPLLAPFFGGPFWFWPLLILVVVELSHSAIAKERSQNTLDLLFCASLSSGQVVTGKYMAMLVTWIIMWLCTLPLLFFFWAVLPPGVTLATGPVLSGYLGVLTVGAASLAIGLFFSSLTPDTRLAAMLTFVVLFAFVLLRILTMPTFGIVQDPRTASILDTFNFFNIQERFSRGIIHVPDLVLLGLIGTGAVAGAGRVLGHHLRVPSRFAALDPVAAFFLGVLLLAFAHRGDHRLDLVARDPVDIRLENRILELREPVTAYLFTAIPVTAFPYSPLPELQEHLERISRKSPYLRWENITTVQPGGRANSLAERFGISLPSPENDATGILEGRLVIASELRHHVIHLADLFIMDITEDAVTFHGIQLQAALTRALLRLQQHEDITLCFSSGHQERSILDSRPQGLSRLAAGLQLSGFAVQEIHLLAPVPAHCRVVIVADPKQDLLAVSREHLDTHLGHHKGLLFLSSRQPGPGWTRLLEDCGIGFTGFTVQDPSRAARIAEPGLFIVSWPRHNAQLLMNTPAALRLRDPAQALLSTSGEARQVSDTGQVAFEGETPLSGLCEFSGGGRLVALGFVDSFSNSNMDPDGRRSDASIPWLTEQMQWVVQEPVETGMEPFVLEHHKLVLPARQVTRIQWFALCLWPLFFCLIGLWTARRRRRS